MANITRRGALQYTSNLDRIAQAIQTHHEALGIDVKIATDFAYRCDLLSDAIERQAAEVEKQAAEDNSSILGDTGSLDPAVIGEDVGGPLEIVEPPSEPWMDGHFSQEKFHDLGDLQESGALGPVHLAAKLASVEAKLDTLLKAFKRS